MRKRKNNILLIILTILTIIILCSCSNDIGKNNTCENINIFPKDEESWVGDPYALLRW